MIISFDLIRDGEPQTSLAIGSILAYLKNDKRCKTDFDVDHVSINMNELSSGTLVTDLEVYFKKTEFQRYQFIALSAYIWNEFLINPLMEHIRSKYYFSGQFILGGYQISYSENPKMEYPYGDCFISGYAEKSLLEILTENIENEEVNHQLDFDSIPSPYLSGEILIDINQKMVRLETKRGCPYRCSFCAHRDLKQNKVHKHGLDKVFEELHFFQKMNVQKINIIDPIFNVGSNYIEVLQEMHRIALKCKITMQGRFEMIKGEKGGLFLDLCEKLNVTIEFGLQTAIPKESMVINRKNNPTEIKKVMQKLNERNIDFEISLIYGLPHQTVDSFKKSIDFVTENGCKRLTAFPLMLLKGTELYNQKNEFNFKEMSFGSFHIPVVVESSSYSQEDWYEMKQIAEGLMQNDRI